MYEDLSQEGDTSKAGCNVIMTQNM